MGSKAKRKSRAAGSAQPKGDGGLYYHACHWVDSIVTFVRGHRLPALYCRRLADWVGLLNRIGFDVKTVPVSKGKPFANVMLVAAARG